MGIWDAPTAVTVGGSANLPTTNELKVDMHPKLMSTYAPLTPLNTILARMEDSGSHNFQVDWIEKKEIPTTMVVATTESSAGTTVYVVANGSTLVKDTLLYNPRCDDLRLVDADETDNTITVTISQGGKTSSVWKSGDVLHVLPPALAENDEGVARYRSVADSRQYNLHQICKKQFAITRLEDALSTHFGGRGSKRQELKGQKYREYRIEKEKLLYFGGRASGGTAPTTKRMAGGLNHYLRDGTLFKDFGGIMTESGFRNFVGDYKDENPDATEVWLYAAGNVLDIITGFGLDKIRISPESKTYGLDIYTYISRGIRVNLVACPLLDVPVTRGWGWILDMNRIKLKTIDKDTYYPEAYNVGESEIIYDTYRGVYTLMVANEARHAMFVGALL